MFNKVKRVCACSNEHVYLCVHVCDLFFFTHLCLLRSASKAKPILFSKRFSPIFCDTSKAKMDFYFDAKVGIKQPPLPFFQSHSVNACSNLALIQTVFVF